MSYVIKKFEKMKVPMMNLLWSINYHKIECETLRNIKRLVVHLYLSIFSSIRYFLRIFQFCLLFNGICGYVNMNLKSCGGKSEVKNNMSLWYTMKNKILFF